MKVRGAPAIGAAGAFGMLLAVKSYSNNNVYIQLYYIFSI